MRALDMRYICLWSMMDLDWEGPQNMRRLLPLNKRSCELVDHVDLFTPPLNKWCKTGSYPSAASLSLHLPSIDSDTWRHTGARCA